MGSTSMSHAKSLDFHRGTDLKSSVGGTYCDWETEVANIGTVGVDKNGATDEEEDGRSADVSPDSSSWVMRHCNGSGFVTTEPLVDVTIPSTDVRAAGSNTRESSEVFRYSSIIEAVGSDWEEEEGDTGRAGENDLTISCETSLVGDELTEGVGSDWEEEEGDTGREGENDETSLVGDEFGVWRDEPSSEEIELLGLDIMFDELVVTLTGVDVEFFSLGESHLERRALKDGVLDVTGTEVGEEIVAVTIVGEA